MTSFNRRRFLSALSLLGLSTALRGQTGSTEEKPDYYYEAKQRLLRGEIPDLTGNVELKGLPGAYTANGYLEFTPSEGLYPKARGGRFATAEEMHAHDYFKYPRVIQRFTHNVPVERTEGRTYWGPSPNRQLFSGSIDIELPPYVRASDSPEPFFLVLELKGKERARKQATRTQPGMSVEYKNYSCRLDDKPGESEMNILANELEAAGKFNILLKDSNDRLLARIPFSTTSMPEGRDWIFTALAQQEQEMAADRPPRKQVPKNTPSGGTGCPATIATVGLMGLPDSCWELETFRKFRDQTLAATRKGQSVVEGYYERGRIIVSGINQRSDADRVWLKTYWFGVLPLALLIKLRFRRLALAHYRRVFRSLNRLAGA